MNMSKVTRKPLDINTLKGHAGMHLKEISNLSEWLLSNKPDYKTRELAEFLIENGAVFSTSNPVNYVAELSNYLPPKKSQSLSLEPYIERLYTLYVENYRKHKHVNLSNEPNSQFNLKVLMQWAQNVPILNKFKQRSIIKTALYHPDKNLICEAREQAYYAVRAEIQLGTQYNQDSLFTDLQIKQKDKPASIVDEQSNSELWLQVVELHGQSIEANIKQIKELQDELNQMHQLSELQTQTIEANYEQIKELKDELEQIKNLLNTRVQDLLRAVK